MFVQCGSFPGPDGGDRAASKTAKIVGKKHHLSPCTLGGEGKEGKTSVVIADFEYRGSAIDFAEGRKMVVRLAQDYLAEFNRQVNPNDVYTYPFEMKDIDIGIYCKDPFGGIYRDPYLNIVVCGNGKITFFTRDPNNDLKTKQLIKEPYEEALQKIKESSP